jgi:hypothetical protein
MTKNSESEKHRMKNLLDPARHRLGEWIGTTPVGCLPP